MHTIWYYVFYTNNRYNMYERTCGTEQAAIDRVAYLKTIYNNAEYFKSEIPKDYKWFY